MLLSFAATCPSHHPLPLFPFRYHFTTGCSRSARFLQQYAQAHMARTLSKSASKRRWHLWCPNKKEKNTKKNSIRGKQPAPPPLPPPLAPSRASFTHANIRNTNPTGVPSTLHDAILHCCTVVCRASERAIKNRKTLSSIGRIHVLGKYVRAYICAYHRYL